MLVSTYDNKLAMVEEESEQRKRKITQLEEENKRLRRIVQSAKNNLGN